MATKNKGTKNWRTSATKKNTQKRTTMSAARTTTKRAAPGYTGAYQSFDQKIKSYRTLYNQTTGGAKFDRPSTSTLNNFANWINKGAYIQTVSTTQLNRWAGTQKKNWDFNKPTNTRNFLTRKFGKSTVKAVARTKTGSYMVAFQPQKGQKTNYFK